MLLDQLEIRKRSLKPGKPETAKTPVSQHRLKAEAHQVPLLRTSDNYMPVPSCTDRGVSESHEWHPIAHAATAPLGSAPHGQFDPVSVH